MSGSRRVLVPVVVGLFLAIRGTLWPTDASAVPLTATIDTSSLSGTGRLTFDFINGDDVSFAGENEGNNTAMISGSVLGSVQNDPLTFPADSFFDVFFTVPLGGTLQFTVNVSTNFPSGASAPDLLSAFLLDPVTLDSLVFTGDPTGNDRLFAVEARLDPSTGVNFFDVFSNLVTVTPLSVPEPSSLILLGGGLGVSWLLRRRHSRRRPVGPTRSS